ncbi:glycosyltransferase [Magnetovibrio sp. PR-2]|uniref:glycosyltransferase family 4 protein n=1 Tax=Magnetovibrio sp. PR-2 TaxID=3120356 RepID=UPI002FCE059C
MPPINITHVITGLSVGGAEKVLMRLIHEMDPACYKNSVISLTDLGKLGQQMVESGVNVSAYNFSKDSSNILPFMKLCRGIRGQKPDIVQTWMYHADLIGGIAAKLVTSAPIIWNLRQSNLHDVHSKKSTIRTAHLCAKVSSLVPNTIICGSEAAHSVHSEMGYDVTKMVTLKNGFDHSKYKENSEIGVALRKKIGISESSFVVGNSSRYDPQKDHETFLKAASLLMKAHDDVAILLCGENISEDNDDLKSLIEEYGLTSKVHILGLMHDMVEFYSAIDALALSSAFGEGSPNVLGEAMLSGLPCVSTDVGDSAQIVNDYGYITKVGDYDAFGQALIKLSKMSPSERKAMGMSARKYIQDSNPLLTMVQRYEALYRRVYSQQYNTVCSAT